MSQYTYQGQDIYPAGDIPADALEIPVKRKFFEELEYRFAQRHPEFAKYMIEHPQITDYINISFTILILLGMVVNLGLTSYSLVYAAIKSLELQSQFGYQSMTITLFTLFSYVLVTALINTGIAAFKLRKYKQMPKKEFNRITEAIHWQGLLFLIWSFFVTIILTAVPVFLSPSDFAIQPDHVKAARFIGLFLFLLIEKFLEVRLTSKLD